MIDALAFLPVDQVSDGMQYLFSNASEENHDTLIELLTYFDATYVTGTARQIHRQGDASNTISVRRIPPPFEPRKWNIHEATIKDTDCTNNMCESWNHAFNRLVCRANPSFWTILQALQRDQSLAAVTILRNQRGQPPVKRAKRSMTELQKHLAVLCKERRGDTRSLPDCL